MSLIVPAPFVSYGPPFRHEQHTDLFHNAFSDDRHLLPVSGADKPISPSSSSSMTRLTNLKSRFMKVLRLPTKRQNAVDPDTARTTMIIEPHFHPVFHSTTPSRTLSYAGCIKPTMATKGILKKQLQVSTAATRSKRKVWYSEEVTVYDTFGSNEYDRSMDTLVSNICLTPEMVNSIKEDLNHFKFNEMQVHPASRVYTHFLI
ncbi:hypothetical protein BX666DRAFT_1938569 [Dichotomocladium elegans]|nr:hypothetical protein BX666DRAFT_1938569 [Dichotomocladium elegans]